MMVFMLRYRLIGRPVSAGIASVFLTALPLLDNVSQAADCSEAAATAVARGKVMAASADSIAGGTAREGGFARAAEQFRFAIAQSCETFDVYFLLGDVSYKAGGLRTADALVAFEEARNLAIRDDNLNQAAIATGRYAQVLQSIGELGLASQYFDDAVRLHEHPAPGWIVDNARALAERSITSQEVSRIGTQWTADLDLMPTSSQSSPGERSTAWESLNVQILFRFDSVELADAASRETIENLANGLANNGAGTIWLLGHADTRGTEAHNLALSRRRAAAVRELLVSMNPDLDKKLKADGRGASEPIYKGNSEDDHRLNRRLEVFVQVDPQRAGSQGETIL